MHLYLIRHGQSVENTRAWDGSNTNSALTPLGQMQAAAVAGWLAARLRFDVIYASPMRRARQTAEAIAQAQGLDLRYEDRLREVGNAYPDGTAFPDHQLPLYDVAIWGSLHPYKPITENGETWMHFRARIGAFIENLLEALPPDHQPLRVGVVCHGGVIEGFFEHVFQKGPWSAVIVDTNNTGITHLEYTPSTEKPAWRLHFHNSTRHLKEEEVS